jgi:TPR repeat protein
MKKKKRIILLIVLSVLTLAGCIIVCIALNRAKRPIDYDDPESLWVLAERTEQYIIRANPDKDSPARKEALKALEDIAALEVSYDEKARLIHERFPEESFWTDDVRELLKQAEAGDAEAQFLLGCFYTRKKPPLRRDPGIDLERGRCVIKSEPLAAKWFRKAAMQGHAAAQFRLGWCYMGNEALHVTSEADRIPPGHPANKNVVWLSDRAEKQIERESDAWLVKAAENGDIDTWIFLHIVPLYNLSPKLSAEKEQVREAALAALLEAAERGDTKAMIGGFYLRFDDPAWFERLRKAAEQGDVEAMITYARELERKMDDDADAEAAETVKQWRQKAFDTAMKQLDEGNAAGLNELFRDKTYLPDLEAYLGGETASDFVNRIMPRLWERIERGDYEFAPAVIRELSYSFGGKPGFVDLDRVTVNGRFAELGFFHNQTLLAKALFSTTRTPEEHAEGLRLARKLAGLGYADAQYILGWCLVDYFETGTDIPRNKPEGVKWMRKAAEQEDYESMITLSGYLTSGGAPINYFEAVGWSLEGRAHKAGYDSFLECWYNVLAEPFKRIRRRMNAR